MGENRRRWRRCVTEAEKTNSEGVKPRGNKGGKRDRQKGKKKKMSRGGTM